MGILWDEVIGPYVVIYDEWGLFGILLLAVIMAVCMGLDVWFYDRSVSRGGISYPSRDPAPQTPPSPPHGERSA